MTVFPELAGRPLTCREVQVLDLLSQGYEVAGIAAELYLSEGTVKTHKERINQKLGASNAAHAVALGFHCGLLVAGKPALDDQRDYLPRSA